jgi:cytidine deaminase
LSDADQLLLSKAIELSNDAYAPYSEFHVGAAVLLKSGDVVA